jgi:hypothetical protein
LDTINQQTMLLTYNKEAEDNSEYFLHGNFQTLVEDDGGHERGCRKQCIVCRGHCLQALELTYLGLEKREHSLPIAVLYNASALPRKIISVMRVTAINPCSNY